VTLWKHRGVHTDPPSLARIRTARRDESESLRDLHRRASYIWAEDVPNLDANPSIFGVDRAAVAAGRVRVALDANGNLLGFATWRPTGEDAELDDLFVEPRAMRRGIGSALLEDAATLASQAGLARLLVVAHPRTLAFYRRAGFVTQGRAATRFGPALRLARELHQAPRSHSEHDRSSRARARGRRPRQSPTTPRRWRSSRHAETIFGSPGRLSAIGYSRRPRERGDQGL
jgi:GNAT superfamily N-acetyltransferase